MRYDVYYHSSENMHELSNRSIDLIITSPPYCVGLEYEEDLKINGWIDLITNVLMECKRVMKDDGRICWNVPGMVFSKNDKNYFSPLVKSIIIFEKISIKIKEFVIWNQKDVANNTAWGSWRSASLPVFRRQTEHIIIGYNKEWKKQRKGISTITANDFKRLTSDIWEMAPQSRNRDHPAPFPITLPINCINLLSYKYDTVLDPFLGSGTTLMACKLKKRNFVGYEINTKYKPLIDQKINKKMINEVF